MESDGCVMSRKMNQKKKFMILKKIVQEGVFLILKALFQGSSKLQFANIAKKASASSRGRKNGIGIPDDLQMR